MIKSPLALKPYASTVSLLVLSCLASKASGQARQVPEVFTLTGAADSPNGAWCWYQDERAIIDTTHPDGPLLLASAISFSEKGDPEHGDVDLLWRNLATGESGSFELHDQLDADDHNVAALRQRSDGRYLAVYTKHSRDPYIRYRISERPHDPTAWAEEQSYKNEISVCYSNLWELENREGHAQLYNFSRADGFDPNYFLSDDEGSTWRYGGKLMTGPGGNADARQRPYPVYAAHARKAVHFITTDGHPRNEDNGIYHGFISAHGVHQSDGAVMGPLSVERASPYASTEFTTVMAAGTRFANIPMHNAWTIDLEVDSDGNPYGAFSARANADDLDHRFFYARWTGSKWNVFEIAKAGGYLYQRENDYTGLVALHPHEPGCLFISTTVDPRNDKKLERYEIFKGTSDDGGATWLWVPITWNSPVNNLRPIVPTWDADNTALLWLRGSLVSFFDWDAQVVGITVKTDSLVTLGVTGQPKATRPGVPPDAIASK